MATRAQPALAEETMPNQKFFNKLERADLPRHTKQSLEASLRALFAGYDDDQDDEGRVDPSPRSFGRMLEFLSHPHHQLWAPPAIAIDGQGVFVAVWQDAGVFRWTLEFLPNGEVEETYIEIDADGGVRDISRKGHVGPFLRPPFSEEKLSKSIL
jgi:hypothetical protein